MKNIYRIIDANLNRAREGLRVIEEIFRMVLDNKKYSREIKSLRAELAEAITADLTEKLLTARQADRDVGAALYLKKEGERKNLLDIFSANFKRTQEAVRVLEEYGKLIDAVLGKRFKSIRFKLYTLEKKLFPLVRERLAESTKQRKLDFDLYVVTDPIVSGKRSHLEVVRQALKGGAKIVQLRDKGAAPRAYYRWARAIRKLTAKWGAAFIVNDYADIAKMIDADGVHLGQDDVPISVARNVLGPDKIIGISTHSLAQALKAERDGADYVSIGPVFATPSKPGHRVIGARVLGKIKRRLKVPVVAIGGIDSTNIRQIRRAGVKRIAVIRAVLGNGSLRPRRTSGEAISTRMRLLRRALT